MKFYRKRSTFQNVWRQSSGKFCTWTLTSNVLKSAFPIERHIWYPKKPFSYGWPHLKRSRRKTVLYRNVNVKFQEQNVLEIWCQTFWKNYSFIVENRYPLILKRPNPVYLKLRVLELSQTSNVLKSSNFPVERQVVFGYHFQLLHH